MRAGEAASRLGVSIKTLRYYEASNLLRPSRLPNGYRDYSEMEVELGRQVKALTALGLSVTGTKPFIECLRLGHAEGDDCVESLVAYQQEIKRLDALITKLTAGRDGLKVRLDAAARRGFSGVPKDLAVAPRASCNPYEGQDSLLEAESLDHLVGRTLPNLALPSTHAGRVTLAEVCQGRWLLFLYPLTGAPGEDLPRGWETIPGARGCTVEACGFRDHIVALQAAGVELIFGLSTQHTAYQQEVVRRLQLPYALLSDARLELGRALQLPTFETGGTTYYRRLTLVLRGATVEHVFYPVVFPSEHAAQVLGWLELRARECLVMERGERR